MSSDRYHFQECTLDLAERRLWRDGSLVELNARYLDALALLVREHGRLVSKDRFLDEVWGGIAVTDEALTQCIRTLRRQLGDSATKPRFIETVPKHGYRFIAPVVGEDDGEASRRAPSPDAAPDLAATEAGLGQSPMAAVASAAASTAGGSSRVQGVRQALLLAAAGTTGAGVAGVVGGLCYGFAGASQPLAPGLGAVSMLLVLVCLCILAAVVGGAGVSLGIAATTLLPGARWRWSIVGGALGGLLVGATVKLLGLDAFNLLLGHSPGDITGATEGLLLGAAVGFGPWFGSRGSATPWNRRSVTAAILAGAAAGTAITLSGGRLMGGSLDLLAHNFPGSRLRLDRIGALLGDPGFGPLSQAVTGALEGALFAGCIVAAMAVFAPLFADDAPMPATRGTRANR